MMRLSLPATLLLSILLAACASSRQTTLSQRLEQTGPLRINPALLGQPAPAPAPPEAPPRTVADAPAQTPSEAPTRVEAEVPPQAPAQVPTETPTQVPTQTQAPAQTPAAATRPAAPSASQVQVLSADFGLFQLTENEEWDFAPARTVPLAVGQAYGWMVKLKTAQTKVKWREELTLPAPPEVWSNTPQGQHTLSSDRRVSVTEGESEPIQGAIYSSWSVAPGDPKGRYIIRLSIENATPIVFEFDVE
ncbi:MAG: hypothetical protein FWF20_01935 [Betaproteobacteria bacterium]|nr:hypothetical protein [Betaproteobacteria bacterium]MCL2885544.1 hypothetical protein [Betaproteobacteria bacterium]